MSPATPHLVLVPDLDGNPEGVQPALPACKGCGASIRPEGSTLAEFPGTVPNWGNDQCRVCDYLAAGKDPNDRFMPVERVGYLADMRRCFEQERRSRGVSPAGSMEGRIPLTDFLEQIS